MVQEYLCFSDTESGVVQNSETPSSEETPPPMTDPQPRSGMKATSGQYLYYHITVLTSIQQKHLLEISEKEDITTDMLIDMISDDLQAIGIAKFGQRHKIVKKVNGFALTRNAGSLILSIQFTASYDV